jgi:hypothetical protein
VLDGDSISEFDRPDFLTGAAALAAEVTAVLAATWQAELSDPSFVQFCQGIQNLYRLHPQGDLGSPQTLATTSRNKSCGVPGIAVDVLRESVIGVNVVRLGLANP